MSDVTRRVRIGIVGCGAVAELHHLPAAAAVPEIEVAALADANRARARRLAERFGVSFWTDDYTALYESVDGAVLCLPNHLHAPVSIDFLNRGIGVLVEKPMARSVVEAQAMLAASRMTRAVLSVGLVLRLCGGPRLLKRAIDEGWLGTLERVSIEWGAMFEWPVASGYAFDRTQAGGGVLLDAGSHMLDLLVWWFGEIRVIDYADDCLGGVEADCVLSFTARDGSAEVPGTMTLSRLRGLRNSVQIVGDRWTLEYDLRSEDRVQLRPTSADGRPGAPILSGTAFGAAAGGLQARVDQLRGFSRAIQGETLPPVTGEDALPSMRLIEDCYRIRRRLIQPWDAAAWHDAGEAARTAGSRDVTRGAQG